MCLSLTPHSCQLLSQPRNDTHLQLPLTQMPFPLVMVSLGYSQDTTHDVSALSHTHSPCWNSWQVM